MPSFKRFDWPVGYTKIFYYPPVLGNPVSRNQAFIKMKQKLREIRLCMKGQAKGLSAVLVKHYVNKIAARDVMNIAPRSSEFTLIP